MKEYSTPYIEVIAVKSADVITMSLGTETPRYDEHEGTWDFDLNL